MTNKYKPVSVVGKATWGEEEFEANLSPDEERDAVSGGHLELVPRTYRVLSDNYAAGKQGETFEATYPVENEAVLVQGGHIERVDETAEDLAGTSDPVDPPETIPVAPDPKKKKED